MRNTRYPSDGEIKELHADISCEGATQKCTSSAVVYEMVLTGKEMLFPAHLALPLLLAYINKRLKNQPGKISPILLDYLSLTRKLLKLPLF